jgi:hypothetical protein
VVARFLSPALLLQSMGETVAGTGQERWRSWLGQVDDHVRRRDAYFTAKVLDHANVTLPEVDIDLAPFRFREEPSGAQARRLVLPIIGLVSMVVAGIAICMRSTRRWRL